MQNATVRNSTSASFQMEARALWAVFKREWKIFIRYPSWIIAIFIWPVIFPLGYIFSGRALAGPDGSGLAAFSQAAGTQDFLGYIAIGTAIWMLQNIVLWNVGFILHEEQLRGTLESNWLSPTYRFSFLLGGSLLSLVTNLFYLAVSALEFAFLFGVQFQGSLLLSVLVVFASLPAIYGLGFTFASLVITAKEANAFVYLVRGLVMIFCGITFPIAVMPDWMQAVAGWLPQTYMMRAIRAAALSGADLPALLPDLQALALFGAFWLVVGYLAFQHMERRARAIGALGQF